MRSGLISGRVRVRRVNAARVDVVFFCYLPSRGARVEFVLFEWRGGHTRTHENTNRLSLVVAVTGIVFFGPPLFPNADLFLFHVRAPEHGRADDEDVGGHQGY